MTEKTQQENKFSDWQQKMSKRHPILSQVIVNILVAGFILLTELWIISNVLPNPRAEIFHPSSSPTEIKIKNDGWMSADNVYEITTGDVVLFNIKAGKEYIEFEETKDPKVTRAIVKGLPKHKEIKINSTSSDIKINNSKLIGILGALASLITIGIFIVKLGIFIVKFVKSKKVSNFDI